MKAKKRRFKHEERRIFNIILKLTKQLPDFLHLKE